MKAVVCWEKVGQLHLYTDKFMQQLMREVVKPLFDVRRVCQCHVKGHELTFVTEENKATKNESTGGDLAGGSHLLQKMFHFEVVVNFLFHNMPSVDHSISLLRKLGEEGRGSKMLQHGIDCLRADPEALALMASSMANIVANAHKHSFIYGLFLSFHCLLSPLFTSSITFA